MMSLNELNKKGNFFKLKIMFVNVSYVHLLRENSIMSLNLETSAFGFHNLLQRRGPCPVLSADRIQVNCSRPMLFRVRWERYIVKKSNIVHKIETELPGFNVQIPFNFAPIVLVFMIESRLKGECNSKSTTSIKDDILVQKF